MSAKASLLNKNKSGKKRVAWKTRTVPWNIEIRSFVSSNRKFNYLLFLRKNHTLFSFWFRHCPWLFPFDWRTRNNQRLYIIPLEIILQVRRGGRSTALRGGAITVPRAPKLSVYRVANGGGRFSCECPGEKESESQQITRYLGSHAPRKPTNSPEETEPKERERDGEERETGTATETQELFLFTSELISSGYCIWISERSDGTQRGEPRWMRESVEHTAWNFNATFQALLPPRWSILFFLHFRDCSCQPPTPHTLTHARISSLSRAESRRNFKLKD